MVTFEAWDCFDLVSGWPLRFQLFYSESMIRLFSWSNLQCCFSLLLISSIQLPDDRRIYWICLLRSCFVYLWKKNEHWFTNASNTYSNKNIAVADRLPRNISRIVFELSQNISIKIRSFGSPFTSTAISNARLFIGPHDIRTGFAWKWRFPTLSESKFQIGKL